ncbi:probable aminopeptidase NPEPL1 [Daktulosphaira vitifoliae]|uniref:probable aminopeptidase NPEPL1 n=1 Tax=Daktulosphaira vitifoliae TaxID=58002 RepID=UPI0021A9DDE9|nr:probable aminopeptidase NPEPL1 [Daktulosphaira vitifoliae]
MANTVVQFSTILSKTDPISIPVLIVGQEKYLSNLPYSAIKCKLEPRVNEQTFKSAISVLNPCPTDSCPLFLNTATLATISNSRSRHNSSAQPHMLTKLIKTHSVGYDECIVIVCERQDVFASGCAAARAFYDYCRKTKIVNGKLKEQKKTTVTVNVEFLIVSGDLCNNVIDKEEMLTLERIANAIKMTTRIVDTPCNDMNVDHFLQEITQVGNDLNIIPTIISGEDLKKKGFGGIYGVGKASSVEPALAVLSHLQSGATETIAWVGKGIVYDTGGLSIKGKTSMPGMKRDCAGAAAILGAFHAMVKSGFSQNLHAVFCLAENSVGPNSTRPDDVHTLYSGRTVEINNTDAEGRLVLSDGVVYASRDLNAKIILDMATLTGAQVVSTGKYHAAVMSNSEQWEKRAVSAGLISGDLTFPIVYCPELHFCEFSSAIADMKNSVADRSNATSSCAGLFIAAHLGFETSNQWIHVDIAGPAHYGERATGYGVALLAAMFSNYSNDALLKFVSKHAQYSK